jgi:hypothetical protein
MNLNDRAVIYLYSELKDHDFLAYSDFLIELKCLKNKKIPKENLKEAQRYWLSKVREIESSMYLSEYGSHKITKSKPFCEWPTPYDEEEHKFLLKVLDTNCNEKIFNFWQSCKIALLYTRLVIDRSLINIALNLQLNELIKRYMSTGKNIYQRIKNETWNHQISDEYIKTKK